MGQPDFITSRCPPGGSASVHYSTGSVLRMLEAKVRSSCWSGSFALASAWCSSIKTEQNFEPTVCLFCNSAPLYSLSQLSFAYFRARSLATTSVISATCYDSGVWWSHKWCYCPHLWSSEFALCLCCAVAILLYSTTLLRARQSEATLAALCFDHPCSATAWLLHLSSSQP